MTTERTRYRFADPIPDEVARTLGELSPLARQLLFARGVTSPEEVSRFLAPQYETLHDPFLMTDMERAVERILTAMAQNEHIAIYSDYDCDGIPGGVLLHDFFVGIGYANVENYIPHRHHEGYGLNVDALSTLRERGTDLVITVDCGIADLAPAAHARELGMDLIVTDHHELAETLPDAYAVLNPKRDDAYPFPGLCGTGVAWKLVEALLTRGRASGQIVLPEGQEKWWLDVVGLATVADMVPLSGENRVLAHYGLAVLRKTRRPGLQHLFRSMRLDARTLTEDDIGFMIGPRINAASRMDTPEDAFHMLASKDEGVAGAHARHLEKLNNERKGVVAAMVKDIKKRTSAMSEMAPVLVMGNPEWRPALVGLAANTLAESFARPVFLWGRDGREVIKGSCRSDGVTSVVALMRAAGDAFLEFGGHHASGGFSVHHDHIHTLEGRLNAAYEAVRAEEVPPSEVTIDATLTLQDVTDALVRDLIALAPYGEGNPKPLFAFRDVTPDRVEQFGKGKDHARVQFGSLEAIAFFADPESFAEPLVAGKPVTLVAHVERSYFMNRPRTRLRIVDVLPAGADVC